MKFPQIESGPEPESVGVESKSAENKSESESTEEEKVEVTKCNKDDGTVAIHAHLNHAEKSYAEFDGDNNAVFDLDDGLISSFLPAGGDKPAYLVLSKTLGTAVCKKKTVDGVEVSSNFICEKVRRF